MMRRELEWEYPGEVKKKKKKKKPEIARIFTMGLYPIIPHGERLQSHRENASRTTQIITIF